MGNREVSTTRTASATLVETTESASWRRRLRIATYTLYRRRGIRPAFPGEAEVEGLVDLIDKGRVEPRAPVTLTRATAEALGGAILHELCLGSRAGSAEAELIPGLMYVAVLPYVGVEVAAEELNTPPPG
jgi:hypothetical protein